MELAGAEREVRPFRRSGTRIEFGATRQRSAVVLVTVDGAPLPAGAIVRLAGNEDRVSADGGEVYLTALADTNQAQVQIADRQCSFRFDWPETQDVQPRLGPFACERS